MFLIKIKYVLELNFPAVLYPINKIINAWKA